MANRDKAKMLSRLYEQFSESVLSMSDSDLLAAYGDSLERDFEVVRRLIQRATLVARKEQLKEAQQTYDRQIASMKNKQYEIPQEPHRRREMLMAALARRPDMESALTAQFRDFKEMSDSDIESALKQLADLGLLGS